MKLLGMGEHIERDKYVDCHFLVLEMLPAVLHSSLFVSYRRPLHICDQNYDTCSDDRVTNCVNAFKIRYSTSANNLSNEQVKLS